MHDPAPVAQSKKVLVVEDDVMLRYVISEVLRDGGLTVVEAVNGDEALAYLRAGNTVDLVFSDIQMPGEVDGIHLAARIHSEFPATEVLLTSGNTHPDIHTPFVAKPYIVANVLGIVQTMLEGSDGE